MKEKYDIHGKTQFNYIKDIHELLSDIKVYLLIIIGDISAIIGFLIATAFLQHQNIK